MLLIGGAAVADAITQPPRTRRQHLIVWPMFAVSLAAGGWPGGGSRDSFGWFVSEG